jgi:FG-GAP-like repeat
VNGDGKTDLIAKDSAGTWYVATSGGTQFVSQGAKLQGFAIDSHDSYRLLPGDFNGDRKTDLIAHDSFGNWHVATSDGTNFISQGVKLQGYPGPFSYKILNEM